MAPESSTRYHVLPRDSIDSERDSHEYLLPSPTGVDTRKLPKTHSITISPCVFLRIISSILAFVAFMILVIHGGVAFIASDVFLMLTIILNLIMLLCHAAARVFRVTIEFREQALNVGRGSFKRPNISSYFDLTFSIGLMISLLVGWAKRDRWYGGSEEIAASIIGYIVVGFQVILAIPMLDRLSLTFKAHMKSEDRQGAYTPHRPDTKLPVVANFAETNTTAIPEAEQPRESAEDLV